MDFLASTLFSGGGAVRALLRRHDWENFPFGAPEGWPPIVLRKLDTLLDAPSPMSFLWGDELLYFYNDAHREILGDRHPLALARPFPETWNYLDAPFAAALRAAQGGSASHLPDLQFPIPRDGALQQSYFTCSLLPVFDAGTSPQP